MADVPEENVKKTLPKYAELNDLASDAIGGKIIFATDDWFATAENLLKNFQPEWKEHEFTECGKWMDGWETRRKRLPGHDWCIVQLGAPGVIHGLDVDTSFFTGNYAPKVSIQAKCMGSVSPRDVRAIGTAATDEEFKKIKEIHSEDWTTILPMTSLGAGYKPTCHNFFEVARKERWTHVRLNLFPDGGVARLRVYGEVVPDLLQLPTDQMVDLAAILNGGLCIGCSNVHYGHGRNLIAPGRSTCMADGWETARRLDRPAVLETDENGNLKVPGSEWAILRLGVHGEVREIEIDTNHFKGNFPDTCMIEACYLGREVEERHLLDGTSQIEWKCLLPAQKMAAHKRQFYRGDQVRHGGVISHVRVTMAPDGGISRVRLLGYRTHDQT